MKYFVLSDVHSFYEEMMDALNKNGFEQDNPEHCIIVCGDLFDRGPDAKKVLDFAIRMNFLNRFKYIRGNHEDLLFDCLAEIEQGNHISGHHYSNGTVDTICQITGIGHFDLEIGCYDKELFKTEIANLVHLISNSSIDYFELGDYLFVHGWYPCFIDSSPYEKATKAEWRKARWLNGMKMWHCGCRISDKTIVCGHYHCSWGHSHLRQNRKEFPAKNRVNWQLSFVPFIDEGIIALDACTAYSGFCNCIVIEM